MQRFIPLTVVLLLGLPFPAFAFGSSTAETAFVMQPSQPVLKSAHSYMGVQAGYELVVASTYMNLENKTLVADFIVEVRDAAGVTILLVVLSGIIDSHKNVEVGAAWIPEAGGIFQLRTFAVSDLDNPSVLSPVRSGTITVNSFSVVSFVEVGNETLEIPINMTHGWATVKEVTFQGYWPALHVTASVSQEGRNITLTLPLELLEHWQDASNLEYCVGFPLAVMVDGTSVDAEISEPKGYGQVVNIPITSGPHKIDISGMSLLLSPPSCG